MLREIKNILIIEDDKDSALLIKKMITSSFPDTSVYWFDSIGEGLEFLEDNNVDVLILDLFLRRIQGIETVKSVVSKFPSLPIVVLTGHNHIDMAMDVISAGAQDFLSKYRINKEVLFRSIKYAFERKHLLVELTKTKDRFQKFFNDDLAGDYFTDPKGRILMCNDALVRILKFSSKEELLKKNVSELYVNSDKRKVFIEKIIQNGEIQNNELKLKAGDGSEVYIIESAYGEFDEAGNLTGIIGYMVDITERVINENALRDSEERLRTFFETSKEGICAINSKEIITWVNPRMAELTGYSIEELIGKNYVELLPEEEKANFYELKKQRMQGDTSIFERAIYKKNGEIVWTLVSVANITDDAGGLIESIGMFTDVTERKRIRDELYAEKKRADEALKIKSEFLALMSHEIRTPISAILNGIDLIKRELQNIKLPPDSEIEYILQHVSVASARIERTTDAILNASDLSTGNYKSVFSKLDLVKDVFEKVMPSVKIFADFKKIEIIFDNRLEKSFVNADEHSLLQIFIQLLHNAIKFTDIGKVTLKAYNENENKVVVEVIDTGRGMFEENVDKMFEPFTQESHGYNRKQEGNGLGLFIVKKFAEINNAEIEVETKKGKGSKIRVIFEAA